MGETPSDVFALRLIPSARITIPIIYKTNLFIIISLPSSNNITLVYII
jgi:hypothetical protein